MPMRIVYIVLFLVAALIILTESQRYEGFAKPRKYIQTQISVYGGPNDAGQSGTTNVNNKIDRNGRTFNNQYPKKMQIGGILRNVYPVAVNCQHWSKLGGKILMIETKKGGGVLYGHVNNICPLNGGQCQSSDAPKYKGKPMNLDIWYTGINVLFPPMQSKKGDMKNGFWHSVERPKNGYPRFAVVGRSLDGFLWNRPKDATYKPCSL
jgi:hypothetical protein